MRIWKPAIVTLAVSGIVLAGGMAFAAWSDSAKTIVLEAQAASLPAGSQPGIDAHNDLVVLRWAPKHLTGTVQVGGYIVSRHGTTGTTVVCTVTTPGCRDKNVPPGSWTYTVQTAMGAQWRGPAGPASLPAVITGPATPPAPHAGVGPGTAGHLPGPQSAAVPASPSPQASPSPAPAPSSPSPSPTSAVSAPPGG